LGAEVQPHQPSPGGQGAREGVRLEDVAPVLGVGCRVAHAAVTILVVVAWPGRILRSSRRPGKGSGAVETTDNNVAAPRAGAGRAGCATPVAGIGGRPFA